MEINDITPGMYEVHWHTGERKLAVIGKRSPKLSSRDSKYWIAFADSTGSHLLEDVADGIVGIKPIHIPHPASAVITKETTCEVKICHAKVQGLYVCGDKCPHKSIGRPSFCTAPFMKQEGMLATHHTESRSYNIRRTECINFLGIFTNDQ